MCFVWFVLVVHCVRFVWFVHRVRFVCLVCLVRFVCLVRIVCVWRRLRNTAHPTHFPMAGQTPPPRGVSPESRGCVDEGHGHYGRAAYWTCALRLRTLFS